MRDGQQPYSRIITDDIIMPIWRVIVRSHPLLVAVRECHGVYLYKQAGNDSTLCIV